MMVELLSVLIPIFAFLIPLSLGIIGWRIEKNHFARLDQEERQYSNIMVSDLRYLPENWSASDPVLVTGSVVIANDYLKKFIASWIQIFGGRIFTYERMVERARREAVLRMLKEASRRSANVIWCVRITTSAINVAESNQQSGGVEVVAYGTAMKVSQTRL